MTEPTSVYLYYDRLGVLLYVGITKRGITRQDEHAVKEWWPFVAKQEIEHYDSREVAAARETMLIKERRPPFNKQHNRDYRKLRAAYLTLFGPSDAQMPLTQADPCLWCEAEGEEPCPYPNAPDHTAAMPLELCGDQSCTACHGVHHGYYMGIPDGYEIGLRYGVKDGWDMAHGWVRREFMEHAQLSGCATIDEYCQAIEEEPSKLELVLRWLAVYLGADTPPEMPSSRDSANAGRNS